MNKINILHNMEAKFNNESIGIIEDLKINLPQSKIVKTTINGQERSIKTNRLSGELTAVFKTISNIPDYYFFENNLKIEIGLNFQEEQAATGELKEIEELYTGVGFLHDREDKNIIFNEAQKESFKITFRTLKHIKNGVNLIDYAANTRLILNGKVVMQRSIL